MKSFRKLQLLVLVVLLLLSHRAVAQSRQVLLETTKGNIRIELSDETPIHRDNFIKLVSEQFFDSLLFHRVIFNFMVQAGDPDSRQAAPGAGLGNGDVGYTLEPEFRLPTLFHRRGAVAMAREGDQVNPERRSSGCQFYIVWGEPQSPMALERVQQRLDRATGGQAKITAEMAEVYSKYGGTPHLDGQYTVFGQVVEGLDVVNEIQLAETNGDDRPQEDIRIIRATLVEP